MQTKRLATMYSVSFNGVFGRNRSVKHVGENPVEASGGFVSSLGVDVAGMAQAYAVKIGAKRGTVRVTRYDNCEILDETSGLCVIPITQGVIVYNEAC